MIKGSIHQEDVTVINTFASNTGAPIYKKRILTEPKGKINSNKIRVGGF